MIAKILFNGHFLSPEGEVGTSVAVNHNGIISAVGEEELARELNIESVDMRGLYILPVFEDAHNHLAARARTIFEIDLRGINIAWSEVKERIADRIKTTSPESWVVCHGWNETTWGSPTQANLDDISSVHGIFVIHISYHGGLVNAKGAQMLAAKGYPTGEQGKITENEFEAVTIATLPSVDAFVEAIPQLQRKLLSLGIGALHDMHILTVDQLKAFRALEEKNALLFPAILYMNPRLLADPYIPTYLKECGDSAKLVGLKLFLDGAIGVSTAAINGEYADGTGSGQLRYTDEECKDFIRQSDVLGLSHVAMHCIGDRSIDQACRLFKKLKDMYPQIKTWRFEHFEIPNGKSLETLASLGGIASVQPNFSWDVENYKVRLGKKKGSINPLRTMIDKGVTVAFGSDVAPSGPLIGIQWATAKAPNQKERISLPEAIRCYTEVPARIAGYGNKRGKIAPGYQANFTVLSSDPLKEESWENDTIRVTEMWIKGKKCFSA